MNDIVKAVDIIKKGGVIIYPSETSYGFTCDATNAGAIRRIYEIKGRKETKPFIVLMKDIAQARSFLKISKEAEMLSSLAGVSIVVKNKSLRAYKDKVAFRMPASHKISMELLQAGVPLVTTSANLSEEAPIYKIAEAKKQFSGKVDMIIDAGDLAERPLTTLYEVSSGKILRQGAVSMEEIKKCIERVK